MISKVTIKNFAIIKDTTFQFHDGLNIITGETGSGKSVVATAISLALGARADSTYVRHNCEKATIEISGDLRGDEFTILREITFNGKNSCKLNGEKITLNNLLTFCRGLAQIHGQFDNQALLNPETHIELVDRFDMNNIYPALTSYRHAYDSFVQAKKEYDNLIAVENEGKRKREFYRFSADEIREANLEIGEDEVLVNRLDLLQNSEKIAQGINSSYQLLSQEDYSAETLMGRSLSELQGISSYSAEIKRLAGKLESITYDLDDIIHEVRNIQDRLSFSPNELDDTINRINIIDSLKSKYGNTIEEILSYYDKITAELDQIENFDEHKSKLEAQLNEAKCNLDFESKILSKLRKDSASRLSKEIERELKSLNFPHGVIDIKFEKNQQATYLGEDIVEIYISTNKGEPLKPLVKTASGGEVSRIMLAIKTITSSFEHVPTLIFDEVDTGISGITASIVGEKLKSLGKNQQVISITHLPQIAAKGDFNFRIYKESDDTSTFTYVEELSKEAKVLEIARLLGGSKITEATLQNAEELING